MPPKQQRKGSPFSDLTIYFNFTSKCRNIGVYKIEPNSFPVAVFSLWIDHKVVAFYLAYVKAWPIVGDHKLIEIIVLGRMDFDDSAPVREGELDSVCDQV